MAGQGRGNSRQEGWQGCRQEENGKGEGKGQAGKGRVGMAGTGNLPTPGNWELYVV